MNVKHLKEESEIDRIVPVMLQLRPQYSAELLKRQIMKQLKKDYQIAYVEKDGHVVCVAGFYIGESLAWRKHIYVDDLVTDENYRSSGAGAMMIQWLKNYAKTHQCEQLHLDSGVQRFSAHRFYLRERFDITSHHFVIQEL